MYILLHKDPDYPEENPRVFCETNSPEDIQILINNGNCPPTHYRVFELGREHQVRIIDSQSKVPQFTVELSQIRKSNTTGASE